MYRMIALAALLMFPPASFGQQQSLASTMDVYVFPGAGQEATQQSAAGAIIGEIGDDDAGKGAAYGAAAGAVAGRRRARKSNAQAQEQAAQNAESRQEATAEDLVNFKKAFSVCLEAKEYMVKY